MKLTFPCLMCALVFGLTATMAVAQPPATTEKPPASTMEQSAASAAMSMPTPGPEAKALEPFFGRNLNWTGTVPAGSMGPDSKEMTSHGKAICHPLYRGFSYGCEVEDTYGTGKGAMTWKGHMVMGYDAGSKAYKGFSADNTGALVMWNGTLDGDKFVLESAAPFLMNGQMVDDRLTWVRNSDGSLTFTDEHRPQGGEWTLGEKATMRPAGGKAAAATGMRERMGRAKSAGEAKKPAGPTGAPK